jgi:hypothetical protein
MKKNSKRILSVTIRRMMDESPDTSYLGEYANRPENEFAIDRAHAQDCASLESNHGPAVNQLERIVTHLNKWRLDAGNDPESTDWDTLDESLDALVSLQDELMECDCGFSGYWHSREYRYFNPSFNYVGKDGKPADGLTPEEVRNYTRQDYERMERLNRGDWCYIGIRAEAKVVVVPFSQDHGVVVQRITPGGLFGVESDADRSYLDEIQKDELANLKSELLALGFSKRAIATAFKDVQEKED